MSSSGGKRTPFNSESAAERVRARGYIPLSEYPGSRDLPWKLQCAQCGHITNKPASLAVRRGCAYCSKKHSPVDLAEILDLFRERNLQPLDEIKRVTGPIRCRCVFCGEEFISYVSRLRTGASCNFCTGRRIRESDGLELLKDRGLEAMEPFPGTATAKWRVKCVNCGTSQTQTYTKIRKSISGCQSCARNSRLNEDEVRQLFLDAGLIPVGKFPASRGGWESICKVCGKSVKPTYSRVLSGSGCKFCAGRAVDPKDAEEVMISLGYVPLEPYPGALIGWKCKCIVCGKTSHPQYGSAKSKKTGCRYCMTTGINLNEPAIFYLIEHPVFRAGKVGIGAQSAVRVESHKRNGWTVHLQIDLETGELAYELERRILYWIRKDLLLPKFLGKEEMPQRGETETFAIDGLSITDAKRKIKSVLETIRLEAAANRDS